MSHLKALAKDTAIYGLSSILGKLINYPLVILYTYVFAVGSGANGVITNVYAYTAVLLVVLTYGMETGFFRFANKKDENPQKVYSSILIMVGSTSVLFVLLCMAFLDSISSFIGYPENPEYIGMMVIIVALDAFQSIPFSYLRYKERPLRFATIQLLGISMTILLNLFFLLLCPWLYEHATPLVSWFYDPGFGVGYVFLANLISVCIKMFLFIPVLRGFRYIFDKALMKRILSYSFPLMILGLVGILNQNVDKIIFPKVYPDEEQGIILLGIYGACTKIAAIMLMLTQAFRYAYEPFVFSRSDNSDNRKTYADAMKYYIIFALLAYLAVIFYLDILQYIIGAGYREGLIVVPIVMGAEVLMGVYFNLSFWYKLIDETKWGAWFSLIGCIIIVGLNVLFIPRYGYMACAWAGVAGYAVITVISYFLGQKKYPIEYNLKGIGIYVLLAAVLFAVSKLIIPENIVIRMVFRTLLLCIFIGYVIKKDLPLSQIPIINRFMKKNRIK